MAKTYEITGVGPENTINGNVRLFTIQPLPITVPQSWIKEQARYPAVGDSIISDSGVLTLVTKPTLETKTYSDGTPATGTPPLPDLSPAQQAAAQKKSHASSDSSSGSEFSPFRKYKTRPIIIFAAEITAFDPEPDRNGAIEVTFEDGSIGMVTDQMLAHHIPDVGDYWILESRSEGVCNYINPKAVFESKYQLVTE